MMTLDDLFQRWRDDAAAADRLADERGRHLTLTHLAELQDALEGEADRIVSMDEAVQLSGYSAGSLRRMVRDERLENHAEEGGQYAFRRGDLPRKPGRNVANPDISRRETPHGDVGHSPVAGVRPLVVGSRRQIARAVVSGAQV